jgi:acetyl esterase/lipase
MIKGCVPVDTAAYDVPERFAQSDAAKSSQGKLIFGDTADSHRELSPISYVGKVQSIPAFLILHVADRPDSKIQSEQFAKALGNAGVSAAVVPAAGKTHGTINSELGLLDDKPTRALFDFMSRQLESTRTSK